MTLFNLNIMNSILPTIFLVALMLVFRYSSYIVPLLYGPQKKGCSEKSAPADSGRTFECPYDYLLNTYGPHHFKKIISFLKPNLQEEDPQLYNLVLEVMDTVHFGAILVDDVADESMLRKGKVAAHRIYGSPETINRAYLVILNAMMKCQRERPELVPFILDCITEIHQGKCRGIREPAHVLR